MALPDHLQTLQPSLFLLLRSVADMAAVNMSSAYADALVVWSTCVQFFPGLTLPLNAVTSMFVLKGLPKSICKRQNFHCLYTGNIILATMDNGIGGH